MSKWGVVSTHPSPPCPSHIPVPTFWRPHNILRRPSRTPSPPPRAQVTGSWKVWPLAHAINFRFIPSSQRVLYINSIQIGYNCFLSIISNRD